MESFFCEIAKCATAKKADSTTLQALQKNGVNVNFLVPNIQVTGSAHQQAPRRLRRAAFGHKPLLSQSNATGD